MTLYDREAFELYTEGVQRITGYRVVPIDVSEPADELESIYTFSHDHDIPRYPCLQFAIGRVKKNLGQRFRGDIVQDTLVVE